MLGTRVGFIALLFNILIGATSDTLAAEVLVAKEQPAPRRWSIAVYGGPATPTWLTELMRLKNIRLDPTAISAFSANYRFAEFEAGVALEVDLHLVKHWDQGLTGPWSAGSAFVFRWLKTPWSRFLGRGDMGFGNGLSYATQVPDIEARELSRSQRWLWHLAFDMTFGLKRWIEPLDLFLRLHHRSGVFGLLGDVTGGSDYLCFGLRWWL